MPQQLAHPPRRPRRRTDPHLHRRKRLVPAGGPASAKPEPGDVVVIPAGAKHWHGAKADSWFSHIALEVPGEETRTEWLEPVSDAEYAALTEADS